MDYDELTREFMNVMHQMRKKDSQKQMNNSMQGEQFALVFISQKNGTVIPSDISTAMGITSARIAATLNSLESKGYITRTIDPEDRRRILIHLTEEGKQQADLHKEKMRKMTRGMLEYLGEHDAKEWVRIMKRLAERKPEDFE